MFNFLKTVFDVPGCIVARSEVNGYTFRGSNSVIFIFASHMNWGHLIKERICSRWSKFFPLRVDPILERLCPLGKQT